MQRLLSLVTLGVLGGLGWLFLKGGGLDQIALTPRAKPQAEAPYGGYQTPGPWAGSTTPTVEKTVEVQPASSGPANMGTGAEPALRIASFNIQDFGDKKSNDTRVMQTLAHIIRQFDVVAVQEISSKNEYMIPNFVALINQQGRRYDYSIGRRLGNTSQKEQYAYFFDTERVIVDPQSVYTIGDPDNLLHREPLVATFRAAKIDPDVAFTFTLITVHTDPSREVLAQEIDALGEVYRVVRRSSRGEDDVIMLGDFNADDRHLGRLGQLPGIVPLVAGIWTNTRQNKQYDNIVIHQPSTTEYMGRAGVFDIMRQYNLNEESALLLSDHFPVWAEFSVYERDYAGRIASRRQTAGR